MRGGWRHEGAARRMVLLLKYSAVAGSARWLALGMVGRLPTGAAAIVPVPRARLRAWRHGVDPAAALAHELSRLTGLAVVPALRAPMWWPRHAGRRRAERAPPRFRTRREVAGAVLVDDVLTTGATLAAAARAIGPGAIGAVTATTRGVW